MHALAPVRAAILTAATALACLAAAPAQASPAELPMRLPSAAPPARAAAAQPASWLVGARPGATSARIARNHGARRLEQGGAFEVAAARARALAADLRRAGTLTYAEPDLRLERTSTLESAPLGWARTAIIDPGLAPPAPGSAAIAIVDDLVDVTHPDLTHARQVNPGPVLGAHGTMVASAAAALANGFGVFGVYPGAPILSYGLPPRITCADAADAIVAAARARVRIINLSFGSPGACATLYIAVQVAYAAGSLVVASAGNEFAAGNPTIYPAAFPHVLSVAALGPDGRASDFSSEGTAVDVAAPGIGVPLAIPRAFDGDGTPDGLTLADGTSFAAPMVAGAAAWLATARPSLSNGQLADVLRRSARDAGARGYDTATGYGLVRMSGALTQPTPARDLLEPNDAVHFIDGRVFSKPDPYVWRGTTTKRLSATADRIEDPVDIFRIRVPARSASRIRVRPRFGDPNLYVFRGSARSTDDEGAIIASSQRGPGRTDSVRIVNDERSARTRYVVVGVRVALGGTLNTGYRLEFQRVRRR